MTFGKDLPIAQFLHLFWCSWWDCFNSFQESRFGEILTTLNIKFDDSHQKKLLLSKTSLIAGLRVDLVAGYASVTVSVDSFVCGIDPSGVVFMTVVH